MIGGIAGERAAEQQQRVSGCRRVPRAAGPRRVDQQNRPRRAARARAEHLGPVDPIATRHLGDRRAERGLLPRRGRLRLAAPRDPQLPALDHAAEPPLLLGVAPERVQDHQRIGVPLPASREREIGLRQLLGHHPEPIGVAALRPEPESAEGPRHGRRIQASLEEICEVLRRKLGVLVVPSGPHGEPFARECAHLRRRIVACRRRRLRRHVRATGVHRAFVGGEEAGCRAGVLSDRRSSIRIHVSQALIRWRLRARHMTGSAEGGTHGSDSRPSTSSMTCPGIAEPVSIRY